MIIHLRPIICFIARRNRTYSEYRAFSAVMGKRAHSQERGATVDGHRAKKAHVEARPLYNKVATAENAAAVDGNPPLRMLLGAVENGVKNPKMGESAVYWMRMEDLRGSYAFISICTRMANLSR